MRTLDLLYEHIQQTYLLGAVTDACVLAAASPLAAARAAPSLGDLEELRDAWAAKASAEEELVADALRRRAAWWR